MADAPAHGSKYWRADDHVGESGSSGGNRRRLVGSDRYQNGDPNGLDPCELLCRLRDERNVDFSFMHVIKDATEIMVLVCHSSSFAGGHGQKCSSPHTSLWIDACFLSFKFLLFFMFSFLNHSFVFTRGFEKHITLRMGISFWMNVS